MNTPDVHPTGHGIPWEAPIHGVMELPGGEVLRGSFRASWRIIGISRPWDEHGMTIILSKPNIFWIYFLIFFV